MCVSLNFSDRQKGNTLRWPGCKNTISMTAWREHRLLPMTPHLGKILLRFVITDGIAHGWDICECYNLLLGRLILLKLGSARGASAARLRYLITLPNSQIKYIIGTLLFVFTAQFIIFLLIHYFIILWNRSARVIGVGAFRMTNSEYYCVARLD